MKGKISLITGSSQGIGKEIALEFAKRGSDIALNDIAMQEENLKKTKAEIEALGVRCEYFMADVSKFEEGTKMAAQVKEKFGKLDVLVNNAGIAKDRTLAKMSPEEWQRVIDINLTGVFNVTRNLIELISASKGNIVNVSSIVGLRGNFGQTNYAASKGGVAAFTRSLAKEVGKSGVRVNAIAPGFIETPMTKDLPMLLKEQVKMITALGRFGKPQEVATAVAFLASDDASFITGEILSIDGCLMA
ncbi:MAG: 3-oxoacyl-ACP reductase FabG [Candidatus Paceibacterota bacterium]